MELSGTELNPIPEQTVHLSTPDATSEDTIENSKARGVLTEPEPIERDAIGRTIILDGCVRGSPAHVRCVSRKIDTLDVYVSRITSDRRSF